jgi:hypothetical protein
MRSSRHLSSRAELGRHQNVNEQFRLGLSGGSPTLLAPTAWIEPGGTTLTDPDGTQLIEESS